MCYIIDYYCSTLEIWPIPCASVFPPNEETNGIHVPLSTPAVLADNCSPFQDEICLTCTKNSRSTPSLGRRKVSFQVKETKTFLGGTDYQNSWSSARDCWVTLRMRLGIAITFLVEHSCIICHHIWCCVMISYHTSAIVFWGCLLKACFPEEESVRLVSLMLLSIISTAVLQHRLLCIALTTLQEFSFKQKVW